MKFTQIDKMCLVKQRYPTQIQAYAGLGRIQFKYKDAAEKQLRVYECPNCSGFHIRHSGKRI